jgi:hypothetical protein
MKGKERVPVNTMKVREVFYDVFLDVSEPTSYSPQGSARFTTTVSGKELFAETLEGLYKLAMVASKEAAVKVKVPLLRLDHQAHSWSPPTRFSEVTLTGKHQKNGNFLIRYSVRNGKDVTEQVDSYHDRGNFFAPMSKEAQEEGLRLMNAERAAMEAH